MSFVPDPNQQLRYYNRTRHSRQRTDPLFIAEMAHAAVSAPRVSIPGTVHILIESRVDALPEGPRHALKAAAVVGVRFSLPELVFLLGEREREVRRNLSVLRRVHLVDTQGKGFKFVDTLTQ